MVVTVRGGVVSGKVINAAKQAVPGAEVVVNGTSIVAAADGTFLVEGIAGPAIAIKAYDVANKLQGVASGVMNVANGFLRGVTVTLNEAGSITGTVKQADLAPVGVGIQVDIMDPLNVRVPLFTTFTAADGSYSFSQMPLGTYTVEAHDTNANRGRSSAYLNVSGAQVVVPVTFLGKGTITGIVQDGSNTGISGLTVNMQSSSIFGNLSTTAITDTSGSFSFTEVPVGTFSLSTKDDLTNLAASTTGSIAVHAQTVTANLKLASWASLGGHVYRYDGSTPAAGVTVTASGLSTITDNLGAYRFEVLPLAYHTVTAEDKAARAKASVSVSLQTDKETRVQDISLSGSGSMTVTVIDNSLTPVVGATVTLNDGYGLLTANSDAVGALVFDRVYPGHYDVSALSGKLHGVVRGTLTANETAAVFVTIAADPSATISGTVFAPDGLTPAGGVSVTARLQYSYTGPSMTTAGDGTYQFTTLPPGDYSVSVTANGQVRAKVTGVKLVSDGQIETRDLTMIGLGTVTGRIFEPASSVGSPDIPVTVRSLHPDFGRAFSVRTNAAGFYQVDQVPVGSVSVSAGNISQQKLGDANGILTVDGTTLTLDIALLNNAITVPQSLSDGNAFSYSIQGNGAFTGTAFGDNGAALLQVTPAGGTTVDFAAVTAATQEQLGREIALRQADVAGLTVTRKVYVPQDGYFARYLEIFDNLTGADKAVTVGVKSSFSSGYYDYYYRFSIDSTSSGDKLLQTSGQNPDYWSVFDNYYTYGGSAALKSAMVWGGPGAATPASQAVTTPSAAAANTVLGLTTAWGLTVPANGRVAILHFVVQHKDLTGAKTAAERLEQLPPEALAGLSQDELLAIRNFAVPLDGSSPLTAMPPLTGNVTVNLQDTFGSQLTGVTNPSSALPVTLQSTSPIFNRIFTGYADSTTGQVVFKSSNNTYAFQDVPLLLGPYTVTAKRKFNPSCTYYGGCSERPTVDASASGDFTPGSTQTVNTLTFTNSGNISGFIRKSTGEALANTSVELNYYSNILTTSSASDGSYSFKVITPGPFFVNVSVPTGGANDTAIVVGQAVTVIAGQLHTVDLALPPLGTITGQLLTWNGTPVSNTRIDLRGATNGVVRIKTTDTGGNASFGMVPPGAYTLSASDPVSGVGKYSGEVVMVGGENLTQTLQFGKSGRVAATVFFADGSAAAYGVNLKLEILDALGALLTSNTNFYGNPYSTPYFASNEAEFKVRLTYSYNQPSSYYTTFTSVSEKIINGFAGVSTTALPLTVTLPVNRGNVTVQLTNIIGANYSGSAVPVELRDPASGAVWGSCSSDPATGKCTVNNLVVGSGGFAVKVVMNGLVVAETTATMATSGQTQTVTLQLPYDPVAFPKILYDANAFAYEIRGDGALQNGKNYVFYRYGDPAALALTLIDPVSQATVMYANAATGVAEDLGRELSSSQTGLLGLTVKRLSLIHI